MIASDAAARFKSEPSEPQEDKLGRRPDPPLTGWENRGDWTSYSGFPRSISFAPSESRSAVVRQPCVRRAQHSRRAPSVTLQQSLAGIAPVQSGRAAVFQYPNNS